VHLGLAEDVAPARLRAMVDGQDVDALLALLHRIEIAAGDVVYVPPGVLHAIGAGVFLVEEQEPEDLSILLEWRNFALDGARDGHLGLGFDRALQAVEHRARDAGEMAELVGPAGFGASVLPAAADPYFRVERLGVRGPVTVAPGFAILVVTEGDVSPEDGGLALPRGTTAILPHAVGPVTLGGAGGPRPGDDAGVDGVVGRQPQGLRRAQAVEGRPPRRA
jgi:mannose-6-phosphate isomerase